MKQLSLLFLFACSFAFVGVSQRAKNGAYTCTTANTVVNAYTVLTSDAATNATIINVSSNSLTSGVLSSALTGGDLIMIIQMQGASMDIDVTPTASWGGNYTAPIGHIADWPTTQDLWGGVVAYNNAGLYELAEVKSVTGSTQITLQCGLKNSYTASGHVQVVRIPRFSTLTVNSGASITATAWNGSIGGVVALEVDGTTTINGGGKISATAKGFRGGAIDAMTAGAAANGPTTVGFSASYDGIYGAEKGEGIGGFTTEYNALYSRYCRSAPANGGGGGNNHNSGGGGGSNVGSGAYTGKGNPNPAYATAWNLESAGFSGSTSSGGGRGGYSGFNSDQNENTLGPNNSAWGGDFRKNEGGLGGHPLAYSASRIFMGGGGGAGDANTTQGGAGGIGGGIVFLQLYGSVTGSGIIEAAGGAGINTNAANQTAPTFSSTKYGDDGAGGGGGGGAIVISNGTAIPSSIALNVPGGAGGNQQLSLGFGATNEGDGPGGGGAGGMIAFTSGSPTQSVAGGANGVTNSSLVSAFPPNGATAGGAGISSLTQPFFDLNISNVNICSGQTATLTASIVGTLPAGAAVNWYSSYLATSPMPGGSNTLTFTTPALSATTTYYVGICGSGTFRKPVTVTVGGPTISGTASITNATCASAGSISGLTASGGVPTLSYTWNGISTPSANLSGASAGSYTLVVTDGAGCTASSGPYTITSSGGPGINTSSMVIAGSGCANNSGSISGITTTGTITSISWSPGGMSTLNISGLAAGNYTLTVTDNLGCTATAGPFSVAAAPLPTINTTSMVITSATCGANNGSITGITATGTSLTYSWNGSATPGADLTSAAAGNYTLVVTNGAGCTTSSGPHTITAAGAATISTAGLTIADAHCGGNNGSISGLTVSGGSTPYSYSWNSGAYTVLNPSSIPAGTYSLIVTDNSGCTSTAGPFTVNDVPGPVIDVSGITIQDETCLGNDGSISGITVSGSGLTYQWNLAPSVGPDLTGAAAGTYYLGVMDAFGCTAGAGPFTINPPSPVTVNSSPAIVTGTTCGAANGSITGITASGTGLTFSWNGTNYPSADITGVTAGTYTLTVTGSNNCTATAGPFTITDAAGPVIDATGLSIVDETCTASNGSISGLTVSGGSAPLIYSWNSGTFNTLDISGLSAGSFTLTVTDQNGCSDVLGPLTVVNQPGPVIDASAVIVTNESCAGSDGSVTGITATGTGLTFDWNGISSVSEDLSGAAAGSYTLTVTDVNGCTTVSGPYTVAAPVSLTIDNSGTTITDATCGSTDGSITGIQIVGGINPVFSWSNGAASLDNLNIAAGSYTLSVTDDQNCTATETYIVTSPGAPVISNISLTDENCNQANGTISITATGNSVLQYSIDNGSSFQSTGSFTGLTSGSYPVIVSDASGCTMSASVVLANQGGVTINSVTITDASCGNSDGSIVITATGSGLTYSIDNGLTNQPSNSFGSLSAANYTIVVTDFAGCSASQSATVVNMNGPVIDAGPDQTVCSGSTITLTGSGALTYSWSNSVTDGVPFTVNSTNTYTVTGTDAAGCTATDQVTITVEPPMPVQITPSATSGCAPMTVSFAVVGSGSLCTWSFSDGTTATGCGPQTLTLSDPGCADLVFSTTSPTGCVTTLNLPQLVCASGGPDAGFLLSANNLTIDNPTVTLNNITSGATSYHWNFGDGTMSTDESPQHTFPAVVGNYDVILTATDASGCNSIFYRTIYVDEPLIFYVPNSFSPNEDEYNQTFLPVFTSGFDPYDYNLTIFDRWGEVLFESNNATEGWNGSYQGKIVQTGVYTYRIEFKVKISDERRVLHGQVNLIR